MNYTICYISKAIVELTESGIEEIFLKSVQKNNEENITGILLYHGGNFLQVLEGEEKNWNHCSKL